MYSTTSPHRSLARVEAGATTPGVSRDVIPEIKSRFACPNKPATPSIEAASDPAVFLIANGLVKSPSLREDPSLPSLEFESLQGEMAESVEEYLVSMYINVDKEHASFGKLFNAL